MSPELAAVGGDDGPGDGETEAETVGTQRSITRALLEGVKDTFEVGGVDSDAGVGDLDNEAEGFRIVAGENGDEASGGGELGGVAEQVPDDLLESCGIGEDLGVIGGEVEFEVNSGGVERVPAGDGGASDQGVGVDGFGADLKATAADAGDVQKVVNQAGFEPDVALGHFEGVANLGR